MDILILLLGIIGLNISYSLIKNKNLSKETYSRNIPVYIKQAIDNRNRKRFR